MRIKTLLHSFVSATLVVSLSPLLGDAAGIPTTPGWYRIPNTDLQSQCPPNNFNNSGYDFFDLCRYVTEAWNSAGNMPVTTSASSSIYQTSGQ